MSKGRWALLLSALVVAVLLWRTWAARDGAVKAPSLAVADLEITKPVNESVKEPDAAFSDGVKEAAAAQPVSTHQPPRVDWINGFYGGNLYASVQAQLQARKPGSFASVIKLMEPCWAYGLNEARGVLAAPGVANQPNYAERVNAQQQLAARCSSLGEETLWGLSGPLPGDEDGKRFQAARKRLGTLSREPGLAEAVEEMARQGRAAEMLGHATASRPYWQGQLWEGGSDEYGLALQLADYRVHSLPGRERDDLRMLADCMAYDICDYDATSAIRRLPPARVGPVLALADQMAEALRQGNYDAFVKRP